MLTLLVFYTLTTFTGYLTYAWNDNINHCGTWQLGGSSAAKQPLLRGWDYNFRWNDVEKSKGEWDWTSITDRINTAISNDPNITILINAQTGEGAPTWIYNDGVPKVMLQGGSGPWPYYLDSHYQQLFKNYIDNVYKFITSLPDKTKSHIMGTVAMFGSTGDDTPWHGTPTNSKYDISNDQWWDYEKNIVAPYLCKTYRPTFPQFILEWNYGGDFTKINWTLENCPGSYFHSGQVGHGYQLNDEQKDYDTLGNLSRNTVQNNVTIRTKGEMDGQTSGSGQWKEAPYWNVFTCAQWGLTYGLDLHDWTDSELNTKGFEPSFSFLNENSGLKHASQATIAWIGLHDGLDSSDTKRFPESKYGTANINNADRMVSVCKTFENYGCKQEDPSAATGGAMNQRYAKKMNDVGWNIWSNNYAQWITQRYAMNTSKGYWRVGNKDSDMYGRFARGFDNAKGMNTMCFMFDKELWNGLPIKDPIKSKFEVSIVYYDQGNGKFKFGYDDVNNGKCKGNNSSIVVNKKNSMQWKTETFTISDNAYFGERCEYSSDFCLFSQDTENDLFSFIQISKFQ